VTSLSAKARVAGLLYILASVVGVVRLVYVPRVLFVHDNAQATANNIAAHESLFRWGIATYLLSSVLFLFVPLALYRLLKGVDQGLAALMVILGSLMQVPIFFINSATDAAALLLVRGPSFLSVFDDAQRDALARLSLDVHSQLDFANGIFWGLWLFPFGLLIYRSRFVPRILGVWLMVACVAWLVYSLSGFLAPGHAAQIFTWIQPLTVGEIATALWLLIAGANEPPVRGASA
jgi:hypothetical protein